MRMEAAGRKRERMEMRLKPVGRRDSGIQLSKKAVSRSREKRYRSLDSANGHYGVDDGGPLAGRRWASGFLQIRKLLKRA